MAVFPITAAFRVILLAYMRQQNRFSKIPFWAGFSGWPAHSEISKMWYVLKAWPLNNVFGQQFYFQMRYDLRWATNLFIYDSEFESNRICLLLEMRKGIVWNLDNKLYYRPPTWQQKLVKWLGPSRVIVTVMSRRDAPERRLLEIWQLCQRCDFNVAQFDYVTVYAFHKPPKPYWWCEVVFSWALNRS